MRTTKSSAFALLLFLFLAWNPLGAETKINGSSYVGLTDIAKELGMTFSWVERGKEAKLSTRWTRLEFTLHKRWLFLNGERIFLGLPIALNKGDLMISRRDYDMTLKPLLTPSRFAPVPKLYRIVIDPGHGGKDPGAESQDKKLNEKILTLDIALRLKRKLESYGYKVILTRTEDKYVPLSTRPAIANKYGADLFVSIHFNAVGDSRVDGVETFIMTPQDLPSSSTTKITSSARRSYPGNANDPWNVLAGYFMQTALVRNLQVDDRGLKRARFAVLKDLNCPGVLVECGFLTNPTDAYKLRSEAYREKIANALLEGILLYQKKLNILRGR